MLNAAQLREVEQLVRDHEHDLRALAADDDDPLDSRYDHCRCELCQDWEPDDA